MAQCTNNPFNPQYPAGRFFTGRERQLKQLYERLDGLAGGTFSNLCVIGRGGEGKTSYLEKVLEEARQREMIASISSLDPQKPAEANIDNIVQGLLREIESATNQTQLESDWKGGASSSYRTPRNEEIIADDLKIDLENVLKLLPNDRPRCCVICVDEAQRIHPIALTALKNALQQLKSGYMIVLSLLNDLWPEKRNADAGPFILDDLASRSGDPGASRFFKYNGIPLGPFDTQKEAEDCIRTRLKDNRITFAEDVISQVPRIVGRHPSGIVELSKIVYEDTNDREVTVADERMLREAFINNYNVDVTAAISFIQQLSNNEKRIYRAALARDSAFTPLQIAVDISSNLRDFPTDQLVEDISIALEHLLQAGFCRKEGEKNYRFSESIRTYALRLALEK